jgi:hypothetical protein
MKKRTESELSGLTPEGLQNKSRDFDENRKAKQRVPLEKLDPAVLSIPSVF